jgi:hypothetical protein
VVGKLEKELRDHELVHWGCFSILILLRKCFLSTYHETSCVEPVYAGLFVLGVVIVMF